MFLLPPQESGLQGAVAQCLNDGDYMVFVLASGQKQY